MSIQFHDPGLRVRPAGLVAIHDGVRDTRAVGRKLDFASRAELIEIGAGQLGLSPARRQQECGEAQCEFHLVIMTQLRGGVWHCL
jgi:hypothetical protein